MSEALRFTVLKEYMQKNKIKLNLDNRKSIEYYNRQVADGKVTLSRLIIGLYYLSRLAGLGLILGLFFIVFIDPWLYGLLICLTSVYVRFRAWKYLKTQALQYTHQQALTSEENFKKLYQNNTFTLKNNETGKTVRHPEKWVMVLPKKLEVQSELASVE
ncbi:hypothetical protein V6C27_08975 [Peptococcaceae bacterium 1198_IL3148]